MIVLLVSLLVLVLVILFVPGAEPMTKLVLLSTLLIAVIAYSIYVIVTDKGSPTSSTTPSNNNGNGSCQPSYCQECNANPCRCAEVIPNQTECPKCRGLLGASPAEGIKSCHECGRCYRCPGCLLQ